MRILTSSLFLYFALAPFLGRAQTGGTRQTMSEVRPPEEIPPAASGRNDEPANSQSGCGNGYSGTVLVKGEPMAGAAVAVKGTKVLVVTNGMGFFTLPAVVRLYPTLLVDAMGYAPLAFTYSDCEPVTIELHPLANVHFKKHGRKKGFLIQPKRRRSL